MTTTLVPAAQVVAQPDLAAVPPAQLPITRSDLPSDGQGAQFAQLPAGRVDIVYADPPWRYYGSLRARLGDNRWIGPRLRHEAEPLRLNCELVGFLAPQDQHDLLREFSANRPPFLAGHLPRQRSTKSMFFRHTSAMFLPAADRWEPAPGWTGWGDELQQL